MMQVHVKGFTSNKNDAIIVIECECGACYMLDEAGELQAEELFVYRYGVQVKNLRCSCVESDTMMVGDKSQCQERYRITLHNEDAPAIEVAHVARRPHEEVLESKTIKFPPKMVAADESINPPPSTEYVRKPYLHH
jgi:hypothetical protein